MAGKKRIGDGDMSESDIEFFRRELRSKEASQLTLITGTGDEAQKVLRDMIESGASIQDGKLSEKHESAINGNKMRIEETIRIEESLAQGSAMPGMTLRAKRGHMRRQSVDRQKIIDLTIADDMKQINYPRELKRAIDTSDLKKHIDETFQEADFSVKEFETEKYPKTSQAYLKEAAFYCKKAREYRAKALTAAKEADYYTKLSLGNEIDILDQFIQVSNKYREVEKEYYEVFYYCIQEAVYWKIKAEIYNNSEQDKKRIEDPKKTSSCKIHSENDITKFVYIPTDKKNIDADIIDLELTKAGLSGRNGVDNMMLIVKEVDECKRQNTLEMMESLSFYGGEFKDRGMVMVTEERRLIDDDDSSDMFDTEEMYFKNETDSDDYSNTLKILADESRIFTFDKKKFDPIESNMTQMGEFFKQEGEDNRSIENFQKIEKSSQKVRLVTEGVKFKSKLTEKGFELFENLNTVSQGMGIDKKIIDEVVQEKVCETRTYVDKLRIEEDIYIAMRQQEEEERRIVLEKRRMEQEERDRRRKEEREKKREAEMKQRERNLLKEIESRKEELKLIQRNGEEQLKHIKGWLDNCKKKDNLGYLKVKRGYENLKLRIRYDFYDYDPEKMLENLKSEIYKEQKFNYDVRSLLREKDLLQKEFENEIAKQVKESRKAREREILRAREAKEPKANDPSDSDPEDTMELMKKVTKGAIVGGALGGGSTGVYLGAAAGTALGPVGTVVGGAVGGIVGAAGGAAEGVVVGGAVVIASEIGRVLKFW